MIKCKLCNTEFNEQNYPNQCPKCEEKYLMITLTDYQKLVERIQDEQYRIEQLYNQVYDARMLNNKFKNHLNRECDIYRSIKVWFDLLMEEFNIPKSYNIMIKPYYNAPHPCQLNPKKVCNSCGDC